MKIETVVKRVPLASQQAPLDVRIVDLCTLLSVDGFELRGTFCHWSDVVLTFQKIHVDKPALPESGS